MHAGGDDRQPLSGPHRVREVAALIVPGTFLALMPKCPLCFAAYVALGTGFTLSYPYAHLLMRALTALCITTLAFCLVRMLAKHLRQKHSINLQSTRQHP